MENLPSNKAHQLLLKTLTFKDYHVFLHGKTMLPPSLLSFCPFPVTVSALLHSLHQWKNKLVIMLV